MAGSSLSRPLQTAQLRWFEVPTCAQLVRIFAGMAVVATVPALRRALGPVDGVGRLPALSCRHGRSSSLTPSGGALGWDVANRAGVAELFKDVVHEDKLRAEEGAKNAAGWLASTSRLVSQSRQWGAWLGHFFNLPR
jgi:hypothetical protein